jgi:hypothetical protein
MVTVVDITATTTVSRLSRDEVVVADREHAYLIDILPGLYGAYNGHRADAYSSPCTSLDVCAGNSKGPKAAG